MARGFFHPPQESRHHVCVFINNYLPIHMCPCFILSDNWDNPIYILGLNHIWLIIYIISFFFLIGLPHKTCEVSMMPLLRLFLIGPFYLAFLPSCSCELISLDPYLHNQHIHDSNAHRLFDSNIPSWILMWVDLIVSLLTWLTYIIWIGQWYHT